MFENARIKLTLWYLLIIMAVSAFFSIIVYRGFTKELGRGFRFQSLHTIPEKRIYIQRQGGYTKILPFIVYPDEAPPIEYIDIINLAKKRFALQLLIINCLILFFAGLSGYFLAGKTLQPIEDMLEEQKRFTADASHELRTPLASMKTSMEVALRDRKPSVKKFRDLLKSNLEEVDRMKYLTDNLLFLSRYDASAQNLEFVEVDLSEVLRQAIEINVGQAKKKKIVIRKSLAKVSIKGDPQSLIKLFSILIDNAIKYSPEKSEINIVLNGGNKKAIVYVIDHGIGIDKKDIPHIFDRFYRADSSRTKSQTEGFGLGLSIAKSIINIHKGEIKVKSEIGKGSTFKVILPIRPI